MKTIFKALANPIGIIAAIVFAALIGLMQQLDRSDAKSHARQVVKHQKQNTIAARRGRAATSMCVSDLGPHALAVWLDGETVECVSAQGRRLASK